MSYRTRLTKPISLLDFDSKSILNRVDEVFCKRGCTRSYHPQRRQVVVGYDGIFGEVNENRRCNVCISYLVVLDDGAEVLEVE